MSVLGGEENGGEQGIAKGASGMASTILRLGGEKKRRKDGEDGEDGGLCYNALLYSTMFPGCTYHVA